MSDHAAVPQSVHQMLEDARVREPVGRVARDEDVDVARVLVAAAVAAHDLDPELAVNGKGGVADQLEELPGLVARNARYQVIVELDAELTLARAGLCTSHPLAGRKTVLLRFQVLDRARPLAVQLSREVLAHAVHVLERRDGACLDRVLVVSAALAALEELVDLLSAWATSFDSGETRCATILTRCAKFSPMPLILRACAPLVMGNSVRRRIPAAAD